MIWAKQDPASEPLATCRGCTRTPWDWLLLLAAPAGGRGSPLPPLPLCHWHRRQCLRVVTNRWLALTITLPLAIDTTAAACGSSPLTTAMLLLLPQWAVVMPCHERRRTMFMIWSEVLCHCRRKMHWGLCLVQLEQLTFLPRDAIVWETGHQELAGSTSCLFLLIQQYHQASLVMKIWMTVDLLSIYYRFQLTDLLMWQTGSIVCRPEDEDHEIMMLTAHLVCRIYINMNKIINHLTHSCGCQYRYQLLFIKNTNVAYWP